MAAKLLVTERCGAWEFIKMFAWIGAGLRFQCFQLLSAQLVSIKSRGGNSSDLFSGSKINTMVAADRLAASPAFD